MMVPPRSPSVLNMVSLTEKNNIPKYIPPSETESRCILLCQKMVNAMNDITVICAKLTM
uniref:PtrPDR12 n=1 Tax=Arundo donax TaxID=35708 RepID=A0A0A9HP32_ARUDO